MSTQDEKQKYLTDLERAAKFLPGKYIGEVMARLPKYTIHQIKNARTGQIRDQKVLDVLIEIAERERLKRRDQALRELVLTAEPVRLQVA